MDPRALQTLCVSCFRALPRGVAPVQRCVLCQRYFCGAPECLRAHYALAHPAPAGPGGPPKAPPSKKLLKPVKATGRHAAAAVPWNAAVLP